MTIEDINICGRISVCFVNIAPGVESFTTMREAALPFHVITGHQVHGCAVAIVDDPSLTREDLEGFDALITNLPVAIGVRTADCIPVLLYDPVNRAVAAVHSGWRGTVGRIALQTISLMGEKYGTRPADLKAVIGPGIGMDSFQVGAEVTSRFRDAGFPMDAIWRYDGCPVPGSMRGGDHIDLKAANRWLLTSCGLEPGNIQVSGICTYCDSRFYSARREGPSCGRNINAIKLTL